MSFLPSFFTRKNKTTDTALFVVEDKKEEDVLDVKKSEGDELFDGVNDLSSTNVYTKESVKVEDEKKRNFIKVLGGLGVGLGVAMIPDKASALVMGGTPGTSVMGVKNGSNARINPATDETLQNVITGNGVSKKTVSITNSGTIHTPVSGKKLRIYSIKFTLSANISDASFRFTSGGVDFEKYIAPKTGGLYGANNHPNYVEGAIDEGLYCIINGTATVQINIDYAEVN